MEIKKEIINVNENMGVKKIVKMLKQLPLWSGWLINALAWVIFLGTSSHLLEIITGIFCLLAFYIGINKKHNTLAYFSLFDAVWMFAWGFGFFGSSFGFFDLINLLNEIK
ncbi:MAG: hypothetical protein QXG00_07700 [Candidatus Woesearchaeota archaeon]